MKNIADNKLLQMYERWLAELRDTAPHLLGRKYSNPYYTSIPEGWFETSGPRIMVVGEHGVCVWSNIDKIHVLSNQKCILSAADRKLLHSVATRVLAEEIEILNPTHVIFFGWHGRSLKHELPELYKLLYPKGASDRSVWYRNVVAVEHENRTYIFSYHPSWGAKNNGYEEKFRQILAAHL